MATYRVQGGTKIGGGVRPWNVPQPPTKEERKGKGQAIHRETEAERMERELCLSCNLTDCKPHAACPLNRQKNGPKEKPKHNRHYYKEPPPEFIRDGRGPKTNSAWAAELGVSVSTIVRWRRRFGIKRD